jgi:hypothetical protein
VQIGKSQAILLKVHLFDFSIPSRKLSRLNLNIKLQGIGNKGETTGYFLTPLTNTQCQLTMTKGKVEIVPSMSKEPHKLYGKCVAIL